MTSRHVARHRVHTLSLRAGHASLPGAGDRGYIGLGRTLDGTPIRMLITGYDIRIIHAATGEIIRTLIINPHHRYHGTGQPRSTPRKTKKPEP